MEIEEQLVRILIESFSATSAIGLTNTDTVSRVAIKNLLSKFEVTPKTPSLLDQIKCLVEEQMKKGNARPTTLYMGRREAVQYFKETDKGIMMSTDILAHLEGGDHMCIVSLEIHCLVNTESHLKVC